MNTIVANAIVLLTSLLFIILIRRPLTLLRWYLFFRPVTTPFAYWSYQFFGAAPIGTPHLLVFTAGGFLSSIGSDKRLCPGSLICLYAYIFFSLPSLLITPSILAAVTLQIKTLAGLAAYLIAYNHIRSHKDLTYMLFSMIVVSTILPLGAGLYQYVTGAGKLFYSHFPVDRVGSVFVQPNAFGEYLNIIILLLLAMLATPYYIKYRKWLLFLLAAVVVESLWSQNRGAWIGLMGGLATAMVIYRNVLPVRWVLLGGALVGILGGAFIIARFEVLNTVGEWGHSQNTFAGRMEYVSELLRLAMENPFIGKGLGFVNDKLDMPPHNDYLWVFLESGIICSFCYMAFPLVTIFAHLRNRRSAEWRALQFSFFAMTVYFFIHSWLQNIFSNPSVFPFFMACFGTSARLMTLSEKTPSLE